MSDGTVISYIDRQLTARELRGLIRTVRTVLVPERLAGRIRDTEPIIMQKDAAVIAGILEELANKVRKGLREAGIEPDGDVSNSDGLTTREREYAANFGALLCWLAAALHLANETPKAVALCEEGIAWCRISGSYLQEGIVRLNLARLLHVVRPADSVPACEQAVDVLGKSDAKLPVVGALSELAHQLVNRGRFDEAERVIEEG